MMNDRTKNLRALNGFIAKAGLSSDDFGNVRFTAKIAYEKNGHTHQFLARVKLVRNGYDDGKVEIDETDVLTADRFHLDFRPDYQRYSQARGSPGLRIQGSSPKLGRYSVLLTVAPSS